MMEAPFYLMLMLIHFSSGYYHGIDEPECAAYRHPFYTMGLIFHAGLFVMVVDGKCSFSRVKCRPLHAAIQKINLHERLIEFNIPNYE